MKQFNILIFLILQSLTFSLISGLMLTDDFQEEVDWSTEIALAYKSIIDKPVEFLKECLSKKKFIEISLNSVNRSDRPELIKKVVKENEPLFLVDECFKDTDGFDCELSRFNSPEFRNAFEQAVVNEILKLGNDEAVNIVNIGSGGFFSEARILALLRNKGFTGTLNLHLIDKDYEFYIDMIKDLTQSDESLIRVSLSKELDIMSYLKGELNEEECDIAFMKLAGMHETFKQWVRWAGALFGNRVRIFIYQSTEDYLLALKNSQDLQPNMVVCSDCDEFLEVMSEYKSLLKVLKSNGVGLLLKKYPNELIKYSNENKEIIFSRPRSFVQPHSNLSLGLFKWCNLI